MLRGQARGARWGGAVEAEEQVAVWVRFWTVVWLKQWRQSSRSPSGQGLKLLSMSWIFRHFNYFARIASLLYCTAGSGSRRTSRNLWFRLPVTSAVPS